ncbi:granulocyte colony-stimulating factor receptor-like isoform X2 [Paralichthys olivaceus]|uniref:granulocyte colony-stimulating factor receptor-like isoform X2 n=1 Tax=Paralichthys olivaceus TaxID=8255 RepID=UPI003750731B
MATLRGRWVLSILLVHVQTPLAATGPPAPPSDLECFKPCDEKSCSADIHCIWGPEPDPQRNTSYSLHWEPTNSEQGYVTSLNNSAVIYREHFLNHGQLRVWVEAQNKHGSAKSEGKEFNTADIIKPPPPIIALKPQEPLVIEWHSFCAELDLSMETCEVQYWVKGNQVWLKHEDGYLHTYTLDNPLPCTVYEFHVRCACSIGLKSNWSTSHSLSAAKAPKGKLDIWMDCGLFPASFNCTLTWKMLPLSQACGVIVGYEVKLFYNNSTWILLNVSTAEPRDLLWCNETQCHLNHSLKNVSSVSASALNSHGATAPSHVAMPTPGKDEDVKTLNLKMNEANLTVTWDLPSKPLYKLKEYVVQYKQVGSPLGKGFDWVKVTNSQTTVFFEGQFNKYTPFQVSLFSISHSMTVRHLSSVIGYSHEGIPSSPPSFQALSIGDTWVTLFWSAVPLSKQNGVIQYYQIGLGKENVNNVSASPKSQNETFKLKHLSPGQDYEVWIRAMNKAGPGANATTTFKTQQRENDDYLILKLLLLMFVVICLVLFCLTFLYVALNKMCPWVAYLFNEKVPDPRNSHIFRGMKHQINDPFALICIPIHEPLPNISVLEVVKILPDALRSTPKETSDQDEFTGPLGRDGISRMNGQDEQSKDAVTGEGGRTDRRYGREEYSKMVDSDEERDREKDKDDCWSSSEEDQFTSGYEKHFMPTALEVLEV